MSSSPCLTNKTALGTSVAEILRQNLNHSAEHVSAMGAVSTEARSAVTAATASALALAYATPGYNQVGSVAPNMGERIQGLRNRLFLKYLGIDYEFFNVYDIRYREPMP